MAADPNPRLSFIGNATVLLELGPFTVLTDPNFLRRGQRAYLGYGLWSKRLRDPSIAVDELPALDAIVLSHLHGDHWDRVAEAGLSRDVPVLTTAAAARTLTKRGFAAEGMRPWQSAELLQDDVRVTVTALPGRHGPGLLDKLLPDVIGSLIDYEVGGHRRLRMYITGDTLYSEELGEIATRFPDIDVAVVHLGGTKLLGLAMVTMDGAQGRSLMELLRPGTAVPIHHDDYTVFTSPASHFIQEMARSGLSTHVRPIERGETVALAADRPS
jgi:L-ascorbate metabolism protein UlaG (beta-lactamase superfamily)